MHEPQPLYRLATIGAPRGLRGEVRLILHTDNPEVRLAPGTQVQTNTVVGPLVISSLTEREARWFASIEGYCDRSAAELLTGLELYTDAIVEEDAWYPTELTGLQAERPNGDVLGIVTGVEHYPAHDILVIREPSGHRALVPFVKEIVPTVDMTGGRIVIDAPVGLFSVDEAVE